MVLHAKTKEERINEDFLWLGKNTPKLQETIQEKWVAIVNKKVAGIGEDAKEAYNKAKAIYPDKEPLLDYLPKKELLVI